eukprot:TRINITY_DN1703_c0_g1_i4.p1 TRINITY_DN1703_c0_g1~~TRINITY_DN1703_c0_g1_i4.p1  ORF type:complete len:218 (+),score=40.26 TRINITY_DN1703_c0_g1_i4:161-814(+)
MQLFWIWLSLVCSVLASNKEGRDFLEANRDKEGVVELPSGLQYKVLRKGKGTSHPTADSPCECHYAGTLIDGTEFDSSYSRGSPTTFAPSQVIKGWTEAMQLMVEGDKWELYIPSELAYGERGSPPKIPPNSVLVFQIEILKIKGGKKPALSCVPDTGVGCNEKELGFIKKINSFPSSKVKSELKRLKGMKGESMSHSASEWLDRRLFILNQMKSDL